MIKRTMSCLIQQQVYVQDRTCAVVRVESYQWWCCSKLYTRSHPPVYGKRPFLFEKMILCYLELRSAGTAMTWTHLLLGRSPHRLCCDLQQHYRYALCACIQIVNSELQDGNHSSSCASSRSVPGQRLDTGIGVPILDKLANGVNQYINVLGGNWDPTDKLFSSVNLYSHNLLPTCTCEAFPNETTTCIWFWITERRKVCNSTTVLHEIQMLWPNMAVSKTKWHFLKSLHVMFTSHNQLSRPGHE